MERLLSAASPKVAEVLANEEYMQEVREVQARMKLCTRWEWGWGTSLRPAPSRRFRERSSTNRGGCQLMKLEAQMWVTVRSSVTPAEVGEGSQPEGRAWISTPFGIDWSLGSHRVYLLAELVVENWSSVDAHGNLSVPLHDDVKHPQRLRGRYNHSLPAVGRAPRMERSRIGGRGGGG
ncbi:hypothetical protein FA13DRAFT_1705150 [Coprinellus micaceus]|uniref:Uncharacterized protein n=1 Tax=Coprinellus micaceus TaxID=71717 RepID=A0A4Y7TW79_COPMI|nr:hypothetical protein FA13DRAFT_1705150 [Coprinellus micaceus]